MRKIILSLISISFFCYIHVLAKAKWYTQHITKCENSDNHLFQFDVVRHKVNRSHDGFDAMVDFKEEMNDGFSVKVDICQHVDGGCKPCYVLSESSFCMFIEKYTKENVEKLFEMAGIEHTPGTPLCPIPAGKYDVKNYVFNYEELPEDCMFGLYDGIAYVKQFDKDVGCIKATIECAPDDD